MLLKIVNENRGWSETMTLSDISNNQHTFTWNEEHGAYCYEPKDQREMDDIMATNWTYSRVVWKVSPIYGSGTGIGPGSIPLASPSAVSTLRIPPYVKPELYDKYPVADLLLLCADSAFVPEGNIDDANNLKIQLHRYYEGRAWGGEEVKRMQAKISLLEREVANLTAEAAVRVQTAPAAAPAEESTGADEAPKKRGRPPKVQPELQPA